MPKPSHSLCVITAAEYNEENMPHYSPFIFDFHPVSSVLRCYSNRLCNLLKDQI